MAVSKKNKNSKPKSKDKKINPFELKFNRVKQNVLGKKVASNEVGRPGLSKKKAYENRMKSLGSEHSQFGKVNKVVDKRIGQKDADKTEEEKASMRFQAERMKNFSKASKFNLTDDGDDFEETLTHGGRALTDIQKYDRTGMGSDDEGETGTLGADIVSAAHFGGGNIENPNKSRKDVIADIIAKTKQARQEKQMAKDEQEIVTENLDKKYLQLLGKMQKVFRPVGATKNEKVERDEYDKLALTLKFDADARATPAERLKSDKELAAEEMDNLKDLENQRLARMNAKKNENSHISADMDIGETIQAKKKEKKFVVRFDDQGELIGKEKVEKASIKKVAIDSDDELSDEDEEDNEEELDDLLEDEDEVEDEDDDDDDDEEEDEEEENEKVEVKKIEKKGKAKPKLDQVLKETGADESIPFIIPMPNSYKELVSLLKKYSSSQISIVLERLVKCHHPGLKEGNKKLLAKLFLFTLRYVDDISINHPVTEENTSKIGVLIHHLYKLMKFDTDYGVRCVRALIRQNWKIRTEKEKKNSPNFAIIALMRVVSAIYPSSDRWHPVCTPTFVLSCYTLSSVLVSSLTTLSKQILLVTLLGDFVEECKRYMPEAVAFLQGALMLAVEHEEVERSPSNVFPVSLPHRHMLLIDKPMDKNTELPPVGLPEIYEQGNNSGNLLEDNNVNRCRVLRSLIAIIQKYRLLYAVHEYSFTTIFRPFLALLKRIPVQNLPNVLAEEIEILIKSMEAECKSRSRQTQLSQVKTEKSMLKMLEPQYEWNFDPERPRLSRDSNRQGSGAEKKKLQHLYKKEMRGAIKELRKDAVFLGRKQRKETEEKDKDRKQKTKRLLQGLQSQQADWNQEKWENAPKKKRKF